MWIPPNVLHDRGLGTRVGYAGVPGRSRWRLRRAVGRSGRLLSLARERRFEAPDEQDERVEAGQHEVAPAEKDDTRRSYCAS